MKKRGKRRGWIKIPVLVLLLGWTFLPIYWMFSLAVRSSGELSSALSFFPKTFTIAQFTGMLRGTNFGLAVYNSLLVTLVSLAFSLGIGLCCSYILARVRYRLRYKGSLMFWVLLVRILPPIAFALPLYIMMTRAGLLGTRIPLISAHVLINLPFIIWFMISFFEKLPVEVEESAKIDGASEIQLFVRIVLPLILPGITAGAILSFMTSWNEYLYGAIFVQSPLRFTIPLILSTLNSEQELAQWGGIAAGGVLSMIPIILFVVFTQNFLIQGLSGGAVKE
ncbi:MAG: carbohydrate ABC transporter permease [Treponema sp.]|jgi:multiple sugar transport system permease protein|nr:carbohydrate ABC transporter permease [Treponema sp.]